MSNCTLQKRIEGVEANRHSVFCVPTEMTGSLNHFTWMLCKTKNLLGNNQDRNCRRNMLTEYHVELQHSDCHLLHNREWTYLFSP